MATDTSAKTKWSAETRQAIGRPRGGADRRDLPRVEQTKLPDPASLAVLSRIANLKPKISELALFAPAPTIGIIQTKFEALKGSTFGGNAKAIDGPLSQLESAVDQLLVRLRQQPKPAAKGNASPVQPAVRAQVPPPPTAPVSTAAPQIATPLPLDGFDAPANPPANPVASPEAAHALPLVDVDEPQDAQPQVAAPGNAHALPMEDFDPPAPAPAASVNGNHQVRVPTNIQDKLNKLEPMLVRLLPDGGVPVNMLIGELNRVKADTGDPAKHAACLAKLERLDGQIEALTQQVEASRLLSAKTKVNELNAAPFDRSAYATVANAANAAVTTKRSELAMLVKNAGESQDQDIHREVMCGLAQSKDQAYIDNVQKPCDDALKAVAQAIADNKEVKPAFTKRLELLLVQLGEQRARYANVQGITDATMIKQRQNKVAAIDQRKTAIKAAIAKVVEIGKVQSTAEAGARDARREQLKADGTYAAVTKLAQNLPAMKGGNLAEFQKSLKELQTYLAKADPVTRQVLLQDIESRPAMAEILKGMDSNSANAVVVDLVKAKNAEPAFLDGLSGDLIRSEIRALDPIAGRGTALRQDSAATKLTGQYNKTSPTGQEFINQATQGVVKAVAKVHENLDTDPAKVEATFDWRKQQIIAARADKHKALAREAIDGITKTPVPADVANICATIYDESMAKFRTPDGAGDEKQALALVGGHLILRLIGPGMIAALDDPALTPDQSNALKTQSKILQSISNGAIPNAPSMAPFADLVRSADGRPSPEAQKLHAYMKNAVVDGKVANFNRDNIEAILNNDRARAILMEFCQSEYNTENLLFWQEVRGVKPADPQRVYDTYISAAADTQVNLSSANRNPFDETNRAAVKNWDNCPWAVATKEIVDLMRRDMFQRFQRNSPRAAEAIRAAVG